MLASQKIGSRGEIMRQDQGRKIRGEDQGGKIKAQDWDLPPGRTCLGASAIIPVS
jgi:hypothetical protein